MKLRLLILMTLLIALPIGLVAVFPSPKAAAISTGSFNPNRIVDDAIFFNGNRMSTSDVQAFLNAKVPTCDTNGTQPINASNPNGQTRAQWAAANGKPAPPYTCLRDFSQTFSTIPADTYCGSVTGGTRSGADILAAIGQACGINQQALIVLLQKEQGLVTDDWPWPVEYQKATGYACPDTAPCDPAYAGFSLQMYYGARQFKRYVMQADLFNYAVGRTSFVGYNPDGGCGGANLTPNTQITAALYNYTPYQPNAATLAAPEGITVDCGAYGNLNFWRKFNEWFGPTLTDEFSVITADNGDPTQWVLENGKRYVIPDTATKVAWGLSPKWDRPYVFSGAYISTLPSGSTLGRIARPAGGLSVYFVDGGKKYRFGSGDALAAWGYSAANVIDTPPGLSTQASTQGDLTYTVSLSGDPRVFLMDGGTLRHITDPNILAAWSGDTYNNIPISNDYFTSRTQGTAITSPKITDGSATYFVDNSRKLPVDNLTVQLFPAWATYSVSPTTLARLSTGPVVTYIIKSTNAPSVYLVDQQKRHHVIDPNVLSAWQSSTFPSKVTSYTDGFINSLASSVDLSDYLMTSGSTTYVMQGGVRPIPANLATAYTSGRTIYTASTTLQSLYPVLGSVTGLVKATGQPQAYIITDTGQLRHLTSANLYRLWGGGQVLTELETTNLSRYTNGGGISAYVSDGSANYLIENGQKHIVDNSIKGYWGLAAADVLDTGTMNRIITGTPTPNKIQNSGQYFLIREGKAYGTTDLNIAGLWGVNDAPVMDTALLAEYLKGQMLTRVASSTLAGDTRLFIVDRGNLFRLYPNHAANLAAGGPYTAINPTTFTVSDWTSTGVKDEAGVSYVIDGGTKRLIPAGIIRDQWTQGNYANVPTMTNGFLNQLPNGTQIERAIKGSGPNVYLADNFTKRWIQNPSIYSSSYAPFTNVSDVLVNLLPNGPSIP